jgi:hypothetical protein
LPFVGAGDVVLLPLLERVWTGVGVFVMVNKKKKQRKKREKKKKENLEKGLCGRGVRSRVWSGEDKARKKGKAGGERDKLYTETFRLGVRVKKEKKK